MNRKKYMWIVTAFLFGIMLCLGKTSISVSAASSGTCGSNVRWTLNDNGELDITGTGDMANYSDSNRAPWDGVRSSVQSIYVTSGVTSIGDVAFYGVAATNVNIASTVTKIGAYAFKNAQRLSTVTMSSKVTSIGQEAFYGCSALKVFTFPSVLNVLGEGAFASSGLTSASLSSTKITETSQHLFDSCKSLGTVSLPSTLQEIGEGSFAACSSLTNVSIPSSVTKIGYMAFAHDSKLAQVTMSDNVTEIGAAAFYQNTALTNFKMPASIKNIGFKAFYEDGALTYVAFPEGLVSIGTQAFINTGLKEVTLPKSLDSIGEGAFSYCASLNRLIMLNYSTVLNSNIIQDSNNLTEIWGKDGSTAQMLAGAYSNITFYALDTEDAYNCTIANSAYTYDGSAKTPSVTLSFAGNQLSSDDFEVHYVSNVDAGTAEVFVFGKGIYEDYGCRRSFTIAKASQSIAGVDSNYTLKKGDHMTIAPTAKSKITYSSSNTAIVTVDGNGIMTARGVGNAKITITAEESTNYKATSKIISVIVEKVESTENPVVRNDPIDLKKCIPYISDDGFVYNGRARVPSSIVLKFEGQVLREGVDYYYKITTNNVNAGTVTIQFLPVTGGRCYGSINGTYKISQKENQIIASDINLTAQTKDQSILLSAKCDGGARLSYQSNNPNVKVATDGRITVKAKFIGNASIFIQSASVTNYKSAGKTVTVTVQPRKMTLVSVKSATKKKVTVKWKKDSMAGGYEIHCSKRLDFKKGTSSKRYKVSKKSATISGFSSKKYYYFRIRAYKKVGTTYFYGPWSNVKRVKVK